MLVDRASKGVDFQTTIADRLILYRNVNKRRTQQ